MFSDTPFPKQESAGLYGLPRPYRKEKHRPFRHANRNDNGKISITYLTKHYNQQLEVKLNLGMWIQGARRSRRVPKFDFILERPFSGQCRNAIESCAREVVGELDLTAEAEVNFLHALDLVEVNPELRL